MRPGFRAQPDSIQGWLLQYYMAGLNHRTAPVERIARVSVGSEALPHVLDRLTRMAGGGVIVSTCNRTEIYSAAADTGLLHRQVTEFFRALDGRSPGAVDDIADHLYSYTGDSAIRHLFRVATGLDSMVLGEAEIAGQIAAALRYAGEAGSVSVPVSRLFHYALRVSRRARNDTGLDRNSLSVSSIGVQLVERATGGLSDKDVLLVGAGETGNLAARTLRHIGIRSLTVTSRRPAKAAEAAREMGGTAIPMSELPSALAAVDVVITCTASPVPILTGSMVRSAMEARPGRPLFVLDLAVPADVELEARAVSGVQLYGLADLQSVADEHRAVRQAAAEAADRFIADQVTRFNATLTTAHAEPVIRTMGERAEVARQRELARALRRLKGLTPEQIAVLDAMTKAIVNRLLADPIASLRAGDDQQALAVIARILDLEDAPGQSAPDKA